MDNIAGINRPLAYVAMLLVLTAALLSNQLLLLLLAAFLFVFLLPFAYGLTIVFLAVLLGLNVPVSEVPIQMPGFKLYGADLLLFFMAAYALHSLWRTTMGTGTLAVKPVGERRIIAITLATFCFGFLVLGKGLFVQHYGLNDALGDFRRLYFYPLAILAPLLLIGKNRNLDWLQYAIVAACCMVVATGLYRTATGQSWQYEKYTQYTYEPRLLSSTETVTLELGIAFLAVTIRQKIGTFRKLCAVGLAAVSMAMLCISGWRLAFGFALIAPLLALAIQARLRKENLFGVVKVLCAVLFMIAVTAGIMSVAFEEEASVQVERLVDRIKYFDITSDARYYSWQAAFAEFADEPVLGTGLGHQLFQFFRAGDGAWLGKSMTVHCYPLDILYQAGVVGLAFFAILHFMFNVYLLRKMPSIPEKYRATAIGLYVGYLCSFGVHFLEPFATGGIVALYLSMGFLIRLARLSSEESTAEDPTAA